MLGSFSFCSNWAMNSPHKLGWGMVGDWCFDASFGQSRGLSLFFFGCAEPLFTACGPSLVVARRSDFLVSCVQASHCCGYRLLLQSTGSRAQAQYLCCTGLVAPRHVVSSQIRDQTRVLCIGRWIIYH